MSRARLAITVVFFVDVSGMAPLPHLPVAAILLWAGVALVAPASAEPVRAVAAADSAAGAFGRCRAQATP